MIGGLQGIVDHVMVGHFVGFAGNAAIGVGWQIFLVVVVFISSLFTGMGVLVARFAGANEPDKVNRVVYQAFLTAVILGVGVLGPIGWVASPSLLKLVHASPDVRAAALHAADVFVCSIGQLLYFMIAGAARGRRRAHRHADRHVDRRGNVGLNMIQFADSGRSPHSVRRARRSARRSRRRSRQAPGSG
jgi:Na+-driven multidrug efflux pump